MGRAHRLGRLKPLRKGFTDLVVWNGSLRELLQAILDSTRPDTPTVPDITEQITQAITSGRYPVELVVRTSRIAEDLGVPRRLVQLAVSDLAEAGTVVARRHGILAVDHSGPAPGAVYVATRIRAQIAAGIYPPNTALPTTKDLANLFLCGVPLLTAGLRLLADDGLLTLHDAQGGAVRAFVARSLPHSSNTVSADRETSTFTPEQISATTRKAQTQWKLRTPVPATTLHRQWMELRAMIRHALSSRVTPVDPLPEWDLAVARATEVESAPLPGPPWLGVWHTACLASATSRLLAVSEVPDDL